MAERVPVNPGIVEWSGDNPGIYLKDAPDGDWHRLAVYFRITYSPHGQGRAMVVLAEPDRAEGYPAANNVCVTDNAPMMRYLLDEFLSKFPTFRNRPALGAMPLLPLDRAETVGSTAETYAEVVHAGDLTLRMTWREIGPAFAVEVSPEQCATGEHDMYSLFMEAREAAIAVNGVELTGRVVTRPFFGTTMSTAFLAFSETWVRPARPA